MRCISPLIAMRDGAGAIHIAKGKNDKRLDRFAGFDLPCGQCIHCKLERTRQWAVRIMHEAQMHDTNYFVTLTYKDETRPRSLDHDHFQRFMKRLRKKFGKIRFYMCGEYGEINGGAHFHVILFGIAFKDLKLYSEKGGNKLYTSEELSAVWTDGSAKIGAVTMESAQYVASYCTKKITGEMALEHYTRVDPETGEIYELKPEYATMSKKPGLAAKWIEKYTDDVFNYDHVIINGRPQKAPRYYDKYLEKIDSRKLEEIKIDRIEKAKMTEGENTPERLKTAETITRARLKLKRKTL